VPGFIIAIHAVCAFICLTTYFRTIRIIFESLSASTNAIFASIDMPAGHRRRLGGLSRFVMLHLPFDQHTDIGQTVTATTDAPRHTDTLKNACRRQLVDISGCSVERFRNFFSC
jgi:hypothetical protein